ncbi:MAG: hypothetical protein GWN67_10725 [Phycisphaerae bacterium]|nr:hypothetical protein [Phycisphaerae bacterium]NIP52597.1 hypothetical protein [Phycisphaerae bacterium]NIS51581.1 hypothetical protein [Phycisphaerae bacterium]NIU09166.1 hypothetical protein [Phycisphaerae bacterium]NIU56830.1 hypothetical protein [Phycisphaerae bacterium]
MLLAVRKGTIVYVMLILVLLVVNSAKADRRGYVWTYEYQTMPKGESELEYYLTHKVPDVHKYDEKNTWEHQAEYEYGLTDRWDISIYQRWKQTNTKTDDKFEYTGTKVRTRYRLGEKDMYPLDTLLYLEYIKPDSSNEAEIMEGKLILAKDFGKFNIAYNQILKVGINNKGGNENEYAFGMNYEFNPSWKAGFESAGNYTEDKYYIGPTVSWAGEKLWVGIGVLRGLNDRSDDFRARLIMGIPF